MKNVFLRTTLLGLCLIGYCCLVNAQVANFKPGYYLQPSGDTVKAVISLEGERFLTKRIKVKTGGEGVKVFSAEALEGFGFPEENMHFLQVPHTYKTEGGNTLTVKRFALKLAEGTNSLYRLEQMPEEYIHSLSDVKSHVYYYRNKEGKFFKLERVEEKTSVVKFRVLEKYRGALKYLMADWPKINKESGKVKFTDRGMAELVEAYNLFVDPTSIQEVPRVKEGRKIAHVFSLLTAVPQPQSNYRVKGGFLAGYSLQFRNSRKSNALTLGVGIEYMHKEFAKRFLFNDPYGPGYESVVRIPVSADFLLVRNDKVKVGINAFGAFGLAKSEGSYAVLGLDPFVFTTPGFRRFEAYSINELVMFTGAGPKVFIGRVEIRAHVELSLYSSFESADLTRLLTRRANYFVGVGYRLGKE